MFHKPCHMGGNGCGLFQVKVPTRTALLLSQYIPFCGNWKHLNGGVLHLHNVSRSVALHSLLGVSCFIDCMDRFVKRVGTSLTQLPH
jgi:hypothetical protein